MTAALGARPRWHSAARAGSAALALTWAAEVLSALAWMQGATAAGSAGSVDTSLPLFPGSRVYYLVTGEGGSWGWQPGWLCLAAGLLVFLVVARPWRLLSGPAAAITS